jgi:predicted transcriptional regulator
VVEAIWSVQSKMQGRAAASRGASVLCARDLSNVRAVLEALALPNSVASLPISEVDDVGLTVTEAKVALMALLLSFNCLVQR